MDKEDIYERLRAINAEKTFPDYHIEKLIQDIKEDLNNP